MRRRYPLALTVLLLVVASAGCFGSGKTEGTAPSSSKPKRASTDVVVIYQLGALRSRRSAVGSACPEGALCQTIPVTQGTSKGPQRRWLRRVEQHLTCSPDSGTYRDPGAACQALFDLLDKTRHIVTVCGCPAVADGTLQPRAKVRIRDRQRIVPLDFCSLCGLPAGASQDVKVLMPLA